MFLRALLMLLVVGSVSANATSTSADDAGDGLATALLQFYPTPLATSPVGAVEDKAVWLAKVQGLVAAAPPLLRQSMLASTTRQDFEANLTLLEQLQQGTLQKGVTAAKSLAKSGKLTAKDSDGKANPNLGSGPADTVFTYLEPCRIMDTRSAAVDSGVRGPLVGNHLYQLPGFIPQGAAQNWDPYGGNATADCGLNSVIGANIWALAIVITILNPNFDAFLGVGDNGALAATLSTVALNYTHGQGLSTQYIVPQGLINTIYFAMPAQLSANIIFDVVGYFATSQATALSCVYPVATGSGNVAGLISVSPPSCAAGYTLTGVTCRNTWLPPTIPLISTGDFGNSGSFACKWDDPISNVVQGSAFAAISACCRVPGR